MGHAKLSAQLYQAAARAVLQVQPASLRVSSELVLFNRVPGGAREEDVPRALVDHLLEWCATVDDASLPFLQPAAVLVNSCAQR